MKNIKSIIQIGVCFSFAFILLSCSSEEGATTQKALAIAESAKTPEIIAFQNQMIKEIKTMNRTIQNDQTETRNLPPSDELIQAAKVMLYANGISSTEIESKSGENNDALILSKALKFLAEKTKTNTNN